MYTRGKNPAHELLAVASIMIQSPVLYIYFTYLLHRKIIQLYIYCTCIE